MTANFEPKIIGFLCSWCSYGGADQAGVAQLPCPANFQAVRVMCSGRVDPQLVLGAYQRGADGVLILACHPGDCHYKEGNLRALQRNLLLVRLLEGFGVEAQRCRFDYVAAGESARFIKLVHEMVEQVRPLGPLTLRSGPERSCSDGHIHP